MRHIKYFIAMLFLIYIRVFAKIQLKKINPYIIGITGSAGKTSVRNAVYTILKTKYKCKRTGKANSETGIPLDILGLSMRDYSLRDWIRVFIFVPIRVLTRWEKYEKYVVEMAIDSAKSPKNMTYLLKILKPDSAIFINALAVHSENYDHLVKERQPEERKKLIIEEIAKEKGKLIQAVEKSGYVIVHSDDENVMKIAKSCKGKIITVGKKNANIVYSNIKYDLEGFSCKFDLSYRGKKESAVLHIKNQVLGERYGINFGLGIATGISQGINFQDCVKALEKYKVPPGRLSLINGIKCSKIIDSSYNASAQTVLDSLDVLENLGKQGDRRKIAILGDMRELGSEVASEHEKVALKLIKIADEIVLVGPIMKRYVLDIITSNGFPNDKIHWFKTSFVAKDYVKDLIKGGEIILVKGSQNTIFLERVIEEIMEDKTIADKILCRRGKYWNRVRKSYEV